MHTLSKWFCAKSVAVLCAAFVILQAGSGLSAQTVNGSTLRDSSSRATLEKSVKSTGVNEHFTYPDIELWDPARWMGNKVKVEPIVSWIRSHQKDTRPEYVVSDRYKGITDLAANPDFARKTRTISDPDILAPLTRLGLRVDTLETGGEDEIIVAPEKVLADKERKVPVLVVPYVLDTTDTFWAMNTLVHFRKYNELCAQHGDFIISYIITEKPVASQGAASGASAQTPTYSQIWGSTFAVADDATDAYQGDYKRMYLDVSTFAENGAKVADVPNLDWSDDNGKKRDPDAEIEHLGSIPVLNVTGMWTAKPPYGVNLIAAGGNFNPQRIVHGALGEHWMEGISFLYRHGRNDAPDIKEAFDQMGLVYSQNDYRNAHWLMFSPRKAVEQNTKLPLVLILSEVFPYDAYSAAVTYAMYLDYFKLAAQGDMNILLYAGETSATMDIAHDIIQEAERTYPIDPSRVYVTGHSHNGMLAFEFAYRHPNMVAAVAPLGDSSGIFGPATGREAAIPQAIADASPISGAIDETRLATWSKIDMPLITMGATGEVMSPQADSPGPFGKDRFIDGWQRRLTLSRCPMKTREEIEASSHSNDYVTRLFGLPNDGSQLQVIDGVEHYFIDVKNVDGRNHLRIVAIDNLVHTAEPTMPMISWTFMRRFARDQKTGKVIELY